MDITIGKMREVVEFRQNTPPAAGAGFVDSYTTLLTTRGQLIQNSNSRSLSFGAIGDTAGYKLIVRFQSAISAAIKPDTKILISGLLYTHSGFRLIDQKKHLYEFDIHSKIE